uniref:Gag-pol polyprotein n=1 Tax=Solanum tuberosum TaxID=4113 RepID=M1DMI5_SOLTU
MTHAQHVEGDKHREQAKDNKKARIGKYEYSQQKSGGGNRSQFQQKSSAPAPSSASVPSSRVSLRLLFQCAEPEEKDQVGKTREQSAHHRAVPRSSTISPNDPEHDDVEGWCKKAMNYTKGRITEFIGDSD